MPLLDDVSNDSKPSFADGLRLHHDPRAVHESTLHYVDGRFFTLPTLNIVRLTFMRERFILRCDWPLKTLLGGHTMPGCGGLISQLMEGRALLFPTATSDAGWSVSCRALSRGPR